jgi:hypothetical protein
VSRPTAAVRAARAAETRRVAMLAMAGGFAVEVTAAGVRIRDDVPVPVALTELGRLVLDDVDQPIPYVVAS